MTISAVRKASQRLEKLSGKSCTLCGSIEKLQRHHPIYFPGNFMILCQKCHAYIHQKDGTWGHGRRKMRNCVVCGNDFVPKDSHVHKTCNPNCLSKLGRQNALKRWGTGLTALKLSATPSSRNVPSRSSKRLPKSKGKKNDL